MSLSKPLVAPRGPRRCRLCHGIEPAVRFVGLARTTCQRCQARAKLDQAARRPELPPRLRRADPNRSPGHLGWIRTLPCTVRRASNGDVRRTSCAGARVHAHHVRTGHAGGMGIKPPDRMTVPLCPSHHLELHNDGACTFEARHGVNLRAVADALAARSPFPFPLIAANLP